MATAHNADEEKRSAASSRYEQATGSSGLDPGIQEYREAEGYEVNVEDGANSVGKLAKDGRTRLIPQPSDDPNDPLNWTSLKKHLVLGIIALTALLPDYGSATGKFFEGGLIAVVVYHVLTKNFQAPLLSFLKDCKFVRSTLSGATSSRWDREWGMTEDEVNHSQVGNVFMLGAGGIFGKTNPICYRRCNASH
jgi:hypothetical protein